MKKFRSSLIGLTLALLSPLALAANPVPKAEPTGDIIQNGKDIEWNAVPNAGYVYAEEQKLYRAWMRETYLAWKTQWQEPLDQERFSAEHRRVRQILTAAHRRAVRTGEWDAQPNFTVSMKKISEPRTMEPFARTYSRPSRRRIVQEAEMQNAVRVGATMR
ncbi:MAG: hypothetical protein Greene101449_479 [Candidatus Peregrinibacteria bacterium Greene1014_49]|nr:MAG: hypothetical protein Greene101449_479 [Candidatus Peregrinibacteria bacterium Greene1014_49]